MKHKKIISIVLVFSLIFCIISAYAYSPIGFLKIHFGDTIVDVLIDNNRDYYLITAPENTTSFTVDGIEISDRNLKSGDNVFPAILNGFSFNLNIFVPSSGNVPISSLSYTINGANKIYTIENFNFINDNIYIDVSTNDNYIEFIEEQGVVISNKKIELSSGTISQNITITKSNISKEYTIHIKSIAKFSFSNGIVVDLPIINNQTDYTVYAPTDALSFIYNNTGGSRNIPSVIQLNSRCSISVIYQAPYTIKDGFISKIPAETSIELLKSNLGNPNSIKILNSSGIEVITGFIGTGMEVQMPKNIRYKAIVTGDTSGDGKINILDLLKVNKYILKTTELENEFFVSADTNGDGKINILDLLIINKVILKTGSIIPR